MQLVSDWYEKGSILIFVDRQEDSDILWREILRSGYQSLSLHGGKDQFDRDNVLKEFKSGECKILVATSVAARGLDVPSIRLVVNYDVPNHLEDYVHRVGRTGRAGNTGTPISLITTSSIPWHSSLLRHGLYIHFARRGAILARYCACAQVW